MSNLHPLSSSIMMYYAPYLHHVLRLSIDLSFAHNAPLSKLTTQTSDSSPAIKNVEAI